jgi:putative hemolysin
VSQFQRKDCGEAHIAQPRWTVVNIYEAGSFEGRALQWPVLADSGALEVRLAETDHEVMLAQRLRYEVFYEEMSAVPSDAMRAVRRDFDKFDDVCDHLLVVDRDVHDVDGQPLVVGTYRLTREKDAEKVGGFYTAAEFDLGRMISGMPKGTKYLELGRSCVQKNYRARPGTMQLLWKGLMAYVARFDIDLMFGCASFPGVDPKTMAMPLSYLHHFHAMPEALRVTARPELYVPMNLMPADAIDAREGIRSLPAMLKGYVRAGCCIGDGAVIDEQFDTTDVFIFFPLSGIDARYKSRFGLVK